MSRMHEHRDPETGPDHIDAVLTAIPLRDRDGVVIGVMNLCGDVGDHVAAARTTRNLLLASLALIVMLAYLVKTAQIGRLCRDFDVATESLEASRAELEASNRDLAASNVRLVAAEAEARVADEAKTAFLATMSHEMRTPLTAILGYLDLCAESRIEPMQRRKHVAGLRRNTEHLLGLIENLLDVTELHRAQTSPLLTAGSVTALVGEAVAALRDRASAAGLEVTVRWLTAVPATATTDHDRVRQALLKLLDNAVKFSHQGEVELEVAYRHDGADGDTPQLVFHVLDRGCGLPSVIRDDPGQAFRLGDHAANRSHGGSGLGLHIARTVAELLDGGLTAHDRPGGGAHLELRIGLAGVSDSLIRPAGTFGPEDAAPAPPPKPARIDLTGVRVLYAEDGPDNQFLVKAILGRAGALVDIAQNGAEALEMAADAEYDYDVILMDIQMPVMDGLEATRTLRARGYGGPIFALTANAMEADRIDSAAAGCDRHLTKPINRRLLLSSVAESSLAAS
ncbi:response regulator [bacterium]|nr:response regulator [bacterium]